MKKWKNDQAEEPYCGVAASSFNKKHAFWSLLVNFYRKNVGYVNMQLRFDWQDASIPRIFV